MKLNLNTGDAKREDDYDDNTSTYSKGEGQESMDENGKTVILKRRNSKRFPLRKRSRVNSIVGENRD